MKYEDVKTRPEALNYLVETLIQLDRAIQSGDVEQTKRMKVFSEDRRNLVNRDYGVIPNWYDVAKESILNKTINEE